MALEVVSVGGRQPRRVACHVRISDELDDHPKVINLLASDDGAAAFALWFLSLTWLSRARRVKRVDRVPTQVPELMTPGVGTDNAKRLVIAGLWVEVDDGWQFDESDGLFMWGPIEERRGYIPDRVRRRVYRRDGYRCVKCHSGEDLTLDHVTPWSLGGSDEASNLQTLCRSCNSSKGARI